MSFTALYKATRQSLRDHGVDNADLEARMLIRHVAPVKDADFILGREVDLPDGSIEALQIILARRLNGEPVSRIFGEREFWGLPFTVTPDVLDPRHDTEILVDAALRLFADRPPARFLDLGTGSGCIATALLKGWPGAQAVAVDRSPGALACAAANMKRNGVADRAILRQGDWYGALEEKRLFELIVSNPPYIRAVDIPNLARDVRDFDPILALDGGIDGFDSYRTIISGLESHLEPDGVALLEIGFGQSEDIARLSGNAGLIMLDTDIDLGGVPRVVRIGRGDK